MRKFTLLQFLALSSINSRFGIGNIIGVEMEDGSGKRFIVKLKTQTIYIEVSDEGDILKSHQICSTDK